MAYPVSKLFDSLAKFDMSLAHNFIIQDQNMQPEFAELMTVYANDCVALVQHLIDSKSYPACVHFLVLGLPLPEIMWWAYLAALKVEGENANEHILTALTAIRHWVYNQQEDLRWAVKTATEQLKTNTVTRWVCLATYWCGPDINPHASSAVQPHPLMPRIAAANAINKAGELSTAQAEAHFLWLILQGIHIANGGNGQLNEQTQKNLLAYLGD